MSLVGTRPPTMDEWEKYELHHRKRLAIKPGLTGMWQVSGRSDITDFEEVVELDTRYISDVDDIVEGIKRVMQAAPEKKIGADDLPIPPYAVYNIGNSHPENLLEFVDMERRLADRLWNIVCD